MDVPLDLHACCFVRGGSHRRFGPVPSPGMRVMRCVRGSPLLLASAIGIVRRQTAIEQPRGLCSCHRRLLYFDHGARSIEAFVEAQRRGSTHAQLRAGAHAADVTARLRGLDIARRAAAHPGTPRLTLTRRGADSCPARRPRSKRAPRLAETNAAREGRGGVLALGLATVSRCTSPPSRSRVRARASDVEINVRSGRSHAVAEALRGRRDRDRTGEDPACRVARARIAALFEEQIVGRRRRGHVFAAPGRVGLRSWPRRARDA